METMWFVCFEYKSKELCSVVLRKTTATDKGPVDVGMMDMSIHQLRSAVDSAETFLALLDTGALDDEDGGHPV